MTMSGTEKHAALLRIRRRVRAFKAGRAGLPNVWTGALWPHVPIAGAAFCWCLGHRQWKKAQRS